jgi:hypothetical protein
MPPSNNQRAMMRKVLSTFLTTGKPTSREDLLREYPELDDLNDIVWRNNIFKVSYATDSEQYLPSVWVFHFAGDGQAEDYARESVQTLVKVLRAQFFSKRNELSREVLANEARQFEPTADLKSIELGIYLGSEMNLFQALRGGTPQDPQIEPIKISEQILKATEPDKFWDEFTSTYKWHDNRAREFAETYFPSLPEPEIEELAPKEKPWTRGDKITLIGSVAAIASVAVALLVVPEFRRFVGLDKSLQAAPTMTLSSTSSTPQPAPQTNATHDAVTAEVSRASGSGPQRRVDWHDKASWRGYLKVGMTEDQVRDLFGSPDHVSESNGMDQWQYEDRVGEGTIWFADGKLWSWDEP